MKTSLLTIVFIVPSLSQPRCIKRVASICDAGYNCVVYGYHRGIYDINTFPEYVSVHKLGEMVNGKVIENFRMMRKDVKHIIAENGKDCIYYCFGMLSAVMFARKGVKYIYEISDVPYAYPRYDKFNFVLKALDRRIIGHSLLTVMTSGGFKKYLNVDGDKIVVQPNRVNALLKGVKRTPLCHKEERFRFAFIGAIRYNTVLRFAKVIGKEFPQHEFHFYGGAKVETLEKVNELVKTYGNIEYHGLFKSPADLASIYKNVDIVIACYDIASQNERIAEPNKLYESLCFCKPIIVSGGTYLADRVKSLQCGFVLDEQSEQAISSFIKQIDPSVVNEISRREALLQEGEYIDDVTVLTSKIHSLI